jgi:tRNA threonylcarbamoyladenosine biosynthesis protein TsaE
MTQEFYLSEESATEKLAAKFATQCSKRTVIFLNGDLGAGKTTFSRGFLQGLGYHGRVKSPTYTLVEPYEIKGWRVFHFDLYRLSDPEELEYIGIRDYFEQDCLCLIEWPEKGTGLLAEADLEISIEFSGNGRRLIVEAKSGYGRDILEAIK